MLYSITDLERHYDYRFYRNFIGSCEVVCIDRGKSVRPRGAEAGPSFETVWGVRGNRDETDGLSGHVQGAVPGSTG